MQQTLRNLIADGKTKQAIAELRKFSFGDKEDNNQIIRLAASFATYERQSLGNEETPSVLRPELARINKALLVLIDSLDENEDTETKSPKTSAILRGRVVSKGEPKKPLRGANIQVIGAYDKTFTDENGYFELVCSDKEVGDEVSLTVYLKDYTILDETTLRGITLPKNPEKYTEIVLQETTERESDIAKSEKNIIDNINTQTAIQNQFWLDKIQSLLAETQMPPLPSPNARNKSKIWKPNAPNCYKSAMLLRPKPAILRQNSWFLIPKARRKPPNKPMCCF